MGSCFWAALELFKKPSGSFLSKLFFYVMWPGNVLFYLTIPDVRRGGIWKKLYLLEFFCCMVWVGGLSYLVTWWITVIGKHFPSNTENDQLIQVL